MLPIIFSIGSFTIYTLGFLLAIGFFLAAFIIWRRLGRLGIEEEKIIDGVILAFGAGFVFYQLVDWFERDGLSGLSFWFGLIGGFSALSWFVKKQKWDYWRVLDEIVYGILPFVVLFQTSLFFDGSARGKPTAMPWGVYFPGSLLRRQPISLFLAMAAFVVWVFLLRIERDWKAWSWYKSPKSGFPVLFFLISFSLVNFVVAFWRSGRLYWCWAEIILSFLGFALGVVGLYLRSEYEFKLRKLFLRLKGKNGTKKKSQKKKKKKVKK